MQLPLFSISVMLILPQEPIPTVEHFLSILLKTWNGEDYQHEVLALLSHLSLQPFEGKTSLRMNSLLS